MAISSSGIISGLNAESIVSGLMTLEKLPLQRLQRQQSTTTSKLSAMGQIKSAIASLQKAAENIATANSLYTYKGTLATAMSLPRPRRPALSPEPIASRSGSWPPITS